jgi:GAF domain-containing protein
MLSGVSRMNGKDSPGSAPADPADHLYEERAHAAADLFGDVAVATRVREEEDVLVTVAVHHRNQSHLPVAQRVLGEQYRRGEALPGRVWETGRGILLVDVDDPALASIAPRNSKAYVCEVGIRSMMIVPLWEGGRVVGTLRVARDRGGVPYTEEDFARLQSLAALNRD